MTTGILFIATGGGDYLQMARLAAKSAAKHNPDLPIHIHTEDGSVGLSSRNQKLRMDQITPFDHTIYLDCDVLVAGDLTPLLRLTKRAPNIAMALDAGPKTCAELLVHRFFLRMVPQPVLRNLDRRVPGWTPHFNSGVVVFQQTRESAALFKEWRRVWSSRVPSQDQIALMETCTRLKMFPSLIPQEWNYQHCITKPELSLVSDRPHIRILHLAGHSKKGLYQRAHRTGFLP